MPWTFRCSNCLDQLFVADDMMGQQCRCGKCATVLVVPPNAVHLDATGAVSIAPPATIEPSPAPLPAVNAAAGSSPIKMVAGCMLLTSLMLLLCGGAGAFLYFEVMKEGGSGIAADLKAALAKDTAATPTERPPEPKVEPEETSTKKDVKEPVNPDPPETAKPVALKELTRQLAAKDSAAKIKALTAIAAMGAEARPALPALLKMLRENDPEVRQQALNILKTFEPWTSGDVVALGGGLRDSSPDVRVFAAAALKTLGPAARPALPELLKAAGDEDAVVGQTAEEALKALEPLTAADVPTLVKGLGDKSFKVQASAIELLKNLGPAAKAAAGPLAGVVAEGSPALAAAAVEALAKIGPDSRNVAAARPKGKTVYTVLLGALQHKDDAVRAAAVDALDKLGPADERDLEALRGLLKHRLGVAEPRRFAVKALAGLGTVARPALQELLDAFRDDPDLVVRQLAGIALVVFAPDLKLDAIVFGRMLEDADPEIRAAALRVLAGMGDDARVALDALVGALDDKEIANRALAAAALAELGPAAAPAIDGLVRLLMSTELDGRKQAALALGRIGPAARVAVPALLDAKAALGDVADKALGKIGSLDAADVPALANRLSSAKASERILAARGLGSLGDSALPACAALVKLLTDPNKDVRAAAISALGAIGPKVESRALAPLCKALLEDGELQNRLLVLQVLPKVAATQQDAAAKAMGKALGDADAEIRVKAAAALGALGPKAKDGAAALGKALDDKEPAVVKASLDAIAKLGPDAAPAAPELLGMLKKADAEKQLALLKLLGEIGPSAKGVILELAAFGFKDADNKVLYEATLQAMELIGPGDLKQLYTVSKSTSAALRIGAIKSLERAATKAEDRKVLLDNLRYRLTSTSNPERDPQVRAVIAEVIGRLQNKI